MTVLYFLFQNIFIWLDTWKDAFLSRQALEREREKVGTQSSIVTQEGPWQLYSKSKKKKSSILCQWSEQPNVKK